MLDHDREHYIDRLIGLPHDELTYCRAVCIAKRLDMLASEMSGEALSKDHHVRMGYMADLTELAIIAQNSLEFIRNELPMILDGTTL